jgi:hypothetical protein
MTWSAGCSHVDLTEAPLAKDGVTQYEGDTLLLSNMVLRLREGRRAENPPKPGAERHGLSPPQIPTDAGYFYFQSVHWGSVLSLPPRVRRSLRRRDGRLGRCREHSVARAFADFIALQL